MEEEMRPELDDMVPAEAHIPYDMKNVIAQCCDPDSFYEIHKDYADNIIVGFARMAGKSIGIIANQPMSLAGVLDVNSSKKASGDR